MNSTKTIRIVEPAGRPDAEALTRNIQSLEQQGFRVLYEPIACDANWPYNSGPMQIRADALNSALCEKESDYVLAARGGYGASDVLPLLNWDKLTTVKPKYLIGLSDIGAIQSALYSKLGWRSLHTVMPGGNLWNSNCDDVKQLTHLLRSDDPWRGEILLDNTQHSEKLEGELFGGCFAVLTSLIGTPYLPKTLAGKILFFEDISESPGRLMRFWNQWQQASMAQGVQAVLLGHFTDLDKENNDDVREKVISEFQRRCECPVLSTTQFGHCSPSFALGIGAIGRLEKGKLVWEMVG